MAARAALNNVAEGLTDMIGKKGEERIAAQIREFNDRVGSLVAQLSAASGGQEARIRDLEKRVEKLEAALKGELTNGR
jgi:polyhydroxyalkanoate synthesis regulator phasin